MFDIRRIVPYGYISVKALSISHGLYLFPTVNIVVRLNAGEATLYGTIKNSVVQLEEDFSYALDFVLNSEEFNSLERKTAYKLVEAITVKLKSSSIDVVGLDPSGGFGYFTGTLQIYSDQDQEEDYCLRLSTAAASGRIPELPNRSDLVVSYNRDIIYRVMTDEGA